MASTSRKRLPFPSDEEVTGALLASDSDDSVSSESDEENNINDHSEINSLQPKQNY
jgi:hypothetical protein